MKTQAEDIANLDQPRLLFARRFTGARDCQWHVHDAHELVLLTRGRCDISCNGQLLKGKIGTLFILPMGLPQYQFTYEFTGTSFICFKAPPSLFTPRLGCVDLPPNAAAARWFEDICDLDQEAITTGEGSMATGLLCAVLSWLNHVRQLDSSSPALHPALVVATQRITEHLSEELDLRRLSAVLGMSSVHLSRLFRRQFGCGPLRWQQRLRLRSAERMLTSSNLSIGAVAKACGYEDTNYFIRLFRERYCMTPGRWRGRSGIPSKV
jgi:AraC-like DNA-binding protein